MIPKYRAWHKANKTMHKVLEISFDYKEIVIERSTPSESCHCCYTEEKFFKFDEVILMQSTGLKDCITEEEIYAADKVRFQVENQSLWIGPLEGIIKYDKRTASFAINIGKNRLLSIGRGYDAYPGTLKILGSDPELLAANDEM